MNSWIIIALSLLTGGWMLFDGLRAFITGSYTTPTSGSYKGQLGPWTYIIKAVGLDPRSTFMKSVFVLVGLLWLASAVGLLTNSAWAVNAIIVSSLSSLWFLPFGTATGIIVLAIIFFAH